MEIVIFACSKGLLANRHLLDARRMDLMKKDAGPVNAAHPESVDQAALAQMLLLGTIGGAAIGYLEPVRVDPVLAHGDGLVKGG